MKVGVGSGGRCCRWRGGGAIVRACVFLSPEAPTIRHSPWSRLCSSCQELETGAGVGGTILLSLQPPVRVPSQGAHSIGLFLPHPTPPPNLTRVQARPWELLPTPPCTARGHRESPGTVPAGRCARRGGTPGTSLLSGALHGQLPQTSSHDTEIPQQPSKVGILTPALQKSHLRPREGILPRLRGPWIRVWDPGHGTQRPSHGVSHGPVCRGGAPSLSACRAGLVAQASPRHREHAGQAHILV